MGIVDDAKTVADLVKKLGNIDLYEKIIDLRGQIIKISRDKLTLQQKVQELEEQLQLKKKMAFKEPFYYQEGDRTPFCPRCFEKDHHPVHAIFIFSNDMNTRWDCPECKQIYLLDTNRAQEHLHR